MFKHKHNLKNMNKFYKKLEELYFEKETGFLKVINSDGQMHLLNKVKAEFKNKDLIPENIALQVLEERMNNVENSKKAKFENNKKTYYQISLIFEIVFYLIKVSTDERYNEFFENSYKEYLNTFLSEPVNNTEKTTYEPKVDDFL